MFADFKEEMVKKIDDLENRSKRSNLVFWNIPEGEGKDIGCVNLIQAIPVTHMKITGAENILIKRTHRSGRAKSNHNSATSPRPIHVKFLNRLSCLVLPSTTTHNHLKPPTTTDNQPQPPMIWPQPPKYWLNHPKLWPTFKIQLSWVELLR